MLKTDPSDPRIVTLSIFVYRLLLSFFPAAFRREYGDHMAQVFRDSLLESHRKTGLDGLFGLWAFTLLDWLKNVIEERAKKEVEMPRPKLIRLCGWGLVLGALSMGLGIYVPLDFIRLMLYRTMGTPTTLEEYNLYGDVAGKIGELPGFVGLLLVVFGIHGLRMCYRSEMGKNGQTFLDLSFVGGLISITALVLKFGFGNTWWALVSGFVIMFGSLALFGLVAGKIGVLQPLQATLLLSGFWFPMWIVLSLALEYHNGDKWMELLNRIDMPIWSVIVIALILLGQKLQSEAKLREVAR